jgi:hypothetical protein
MKVGDPPAVPTPIDTCSKCKKNEGYTWHWGEISNSQGYAECKGCGEKYK